jgi:hypothetical protein
MSNIIQLPLKPVENREIKILPLSKILVEVLFGKKKKTRKKIAEADHEKQDR